LIAGLRQSQLDHGVPKTEVYNLTLDIMAGLLVVGLICNLLVGPVSARRMMSEVPGGAAPPVAAPAPSNALGLLGALAWLAVALPFAIGLFIALQKAAKLF